MKKLLLAAVIILLGSLPVFAAEPNLKLISNEPEIVSNGIVEKIAEKEAWYDQRFPNAKKGNIVIEWYQIKGQRVVKTYVKR